MHKRTHTPCTKYLFRKGLLAQHTLQSFRTQHILNTSWQRHIAAAPSPLHSPTVPSIPNTTHKEKTTEARNTVLSHRSTSADASKKLPMGKALPTSLTSLRARFILLRTSKHTTLHGLGLAPCHYPNPTGDWSREQLRH